MFAIFRNVQKDIDYTPLYARFCERVEKLISNKVLTKKAFTKKCFTTFAENIGNYDREPL